ncbi:hypothetical protein F5J12DRAFT_805705 [Pisolithus orientalis]|uniref:uncharacterized protein n=1 Tax=Pisolithus orientalis TaxID=936130 RepID=UPI002224CA94|nr:uncharacterized protein F5J12DRAFT_805705 [Pisolithus orientalis]KAI6028488.1 hypothetical protein F5J12DRAFT_805705 [Pisolithus orientalis]
MVRLTSARGSRTLPLRDVLKQSTPTSRRLHKSPYQRFRRSQYPASQTLDMNRGGDGPVCEDSDDDIGWDDDTTLLALLDDPNDSDHDDNASVMERLRSVFASRRTQEKEYIKQVILPAIQDVKHLYEVIDQDISIRFLEGVSIFDNKARHAEEVGRREQQQTLCAYNDTKKALRELFAELEDLNIEKDALFRSFKETLGGLVQQLQQLASELPSGLEDLISTLEKNAVHLGAEDHAKAKERLLRGILEKY